MQSAGIPYVKGDMRRIEKSICFNKAIISNIRQKLVFVFIYNVLGIPVAAGILHPDFGLLLSPIIAGAAISLSSVSVATLYGYVALNLIQNWKGGKL